MALQTRKPITAAQKPLTIAISSVISTPLHNQPKQGRFDDLLTEVPYLSFLPEAQTVKNGQRFVGAHLGVLDALLVGHFRREGQ